MNTSIHQVSYFGSWLSPLPPISHSYSASDPIIQIDAELIAVGDAKVIDPASYKLTGFEELIFHRDTPVSIR